MQGMVILYKDGDRADVRSPFLYTDQVIWQI